VPAALAAALCATPAAAQRLGQGGGEDVSIWRVILALLLCLLIAGGAAFALRKRFGGGIAPRFFAPASDRRLKLVETLRLGQQVNLCLVSLDGKELLIAATPQGATAIVSEREDRCAE
jgi:flagellar biogenesis protein FliO